MELTIGELIDRLITTSQKCWHAQDKIMEEGASDSQIAYYARLAQLTNIDRSKLIKEIDQKLSNSSKEIDSIKTYERKSDETIQKD